MAAAKGNDKKLTAIRSINAAANRVGNGARSSVDVSRSAARPMESRYDKAGSLRPSAITRFGFGFSEKDSDSEVAVAWTITRLCVRSGAGGVSTTFGDELSFCWGIKELAKLASRTLSA